MLFNCNPAQIDNGTNHARTRKHQATNLDILWQLTSNLQIPTAAKTF